MNSISGVTDLAKTVPAGPGNKVKSKADAAIEDACRQVEGFFIGLLMKQSFKAQLDSANSEAGNSGVMLETAIEKMAQEIGDQGGFGFADTFYKQLAKDH